jgi:MFS family permease
VAATVRQYPRQPVACSGNRSGPARRSRAPETSNPREATPDPMPDPAPATHPVVPAPTRPGPGTRLPRGLAAFRHRNYRIFWFAQLASLTGTWMQSLAQSWLVLSLTGSAFHLGLINVCQFGPTLLLGLVGGVVADRVPKRRLLLVTQALAAAFVALLALLVATDAVRLWQIYAVALALGVVNAFDMPARQAFVAELVGKDDLMNAVALNSALFNASRVVGPALAGLLLAQVGAAICFVLNAASYLPVLVGLARMRLAPRPPDEEPATGLERLRQGLAYVRATPAVLLPLALVGAVATFGMNFNVWVPLLAKRDFATGAGGFGLLMAAMGLGSLAGALTLAFAGRRPRRGPMFAMAAAFGLLEGGLALAGAAAAPIALALLLMAGVGFAMSTTMALALAAWGARLARQEPAALAPAPAPPRPAD